MDNIEQQPNSPATEQQPQTAAPGQAAQDTGAPAASDGSTQASAAPTEGAPQPPGQQADAATASVSAAQGAGSVVVSEAVATVSGEAERVAAHLRAIETHALTWGGEIGVAIRNEVCALMDHLGLPRPN